LRRFVETHAGRMWTLQELAEAAELSLTDAKIAAERLVIHRELRSNGNERSMVDSAAWTA